MTPAGAPRRDPKEVLADLRAVIARVAQSLYAIDAEPQYAVLRDRSHLRGQSASIATDAATRAERLWLLYPKLTDAVDALDRAIRDDDAGERTRLLGPAALALPDGGPASLVDVASVLEADTQQVVQGVEQLSAAWRVKLPRLDQATQVLGTARADADAIGVGGDPALAAARAAVEAAAERVAADPLGADVTDAERAVETARARVAEQRRRHGALPASLAEARALLSRLAGLIAEGRDALATATSKVTSASLLEPLASSVLDDPDRGLGPWLARIEQEASGGEWTAASAGLDRWREVADGWFANAEAVVAANRAPLERRRELRGLLEAYRAKAGARGFAEDATLTRLHDAARDVLFAAPCDIDAAERLVRDYIHAVNERVGAVTER